MLATLGVLMTAGLFLVAEGYWLVAVGLYVLGVIGFAGANVAYDAMLLDVARKSELERVSALGFALGYLGGGLLFAINVIMVLYPGAFGDLVGAVFAACFDVRARGAAPGGRQTDGGPAPYLARTAGHLAAASAPAHGIHIPACVLVLH